MPPYCILQLDISGWVHIVCGNILNSKEWRTFKLDAGFLQTLDQVTDLNIIIIFCIYSDLILANCEPMDLLICNLSNVKYDNTYYSSFFIFICNYPD